MQGIWIVASALTLAATCFGCPPEVYVDISAPPGGDGASWATAFNDLQDAVRCPDSEVIHVAEGTYTPGADDSFVPHDGVTILGGYPAGGGARDPDLFETTLTANARRHDLISIIDRNELGVTLDGLTLTGINISDGYAGAVVSEDSITVLKQCRIVDNYMGNGGPAVWAHRGSLTVIECHFENNRAVSPEGCYAGPGAISSLAETIIRRSTFIDNSNESRWCSGGLPEAVGGAVALRAASATVLDCYFERNEAYSDYEAYGGAMVVDCPAVIGNCTFIDNRAWADFVSDGGVGGAISNAWAVPEEVTIFNCVFAGNEAGFGGGAVQFGNAGQVRIANSTFVDNRPDAVYIYSSKPDAIIINSVVRGGPEGPIVGEPIVLFSNVTGGYRGRGNIDIDPMLEENFRLLPGSPCIDAGWSTVIPAWLWGDLDLNPRKVDDPATPNTGRGEPPIDMGAYEFQP